MARDVMTPTIHLRKEKIMRNALIPFTIPPLIVVFAFIGLAVQARGGLRCCARCGCDDGCQKICRLVCENKKIEITCWGCKHEDFCLPGPSKPGCKYTDVACDECDPKGPYVQPKTYSWIDWIPGCCGKIYSKNKLMKKTVTKSVPSFKWVVEDLCPQCEQHCPLAEVPLGSEVPPPPVVDAKFKYGVAVPAAVQTERGSVAHQ